MHSIDLNSQTFGRWRVIERAANTTTGQATWLCECACGTRKTLKSIVLRRLLSQSCGCLKLEGLVARSTKHGHSTKKATPTYHSWAGMVARCQNRKRAAYRYYGNRGIEVCARWKTFSNFLKDMGEKPEGTSLDRINANGNYEPSNCRWATLKEQARNKSSNTVLTVGGRTGTISEWSEITGLPTATISYRHLNGRTDSDAVSLIKAAPGPKPRRI